MMKESGGAAMEGRKDQWPYDGARGSGTVASPAFELNQ
jgi:hypothetical protein